MAEPELKVTVEDPGAASGDPGRVLKVSGEVDIQTSTILDEHVQRALDEGASFLVVDLGDVTFLDSTGLSVLIAGLKRCQSAGGAMPRLLRPPQRAKGVRGHRAHRGVPDGAGRGAGA